MNKLDFNKFTQERIYNSKNFTDEQLIFSYEENISGSEKYICAQGKHLFILYRHDDGKFDLSLRTKEQNCQIVTRISQSNEDFRGRYYKQAYASHSQQNNLEQIGDEYYQKDYYGFSLVNNGLEYYFTGMRDEGSNPLDWTKSSNFVPDENFPLHSIGNIIDLAKTFTQQAVLPDMETPDLLSFTCELLNNQQSFDIYKAQTSTSESLPNEDITLTC